MSWREKVKTLATFRGVSFVVDGAERGGGRRGVTHEYPLQDTPFREDLGRKVRAFTVEGFVFGDDYLAQRDALISALEGEGPGELVHPYYGAVRVSVPTFRVRESAADGGLARFSIDFEETPAAPTQPSTVADGTGAVKTSATSARAAVAAGFLATYVTDATIKTSVAGALRNATLVLNEQLQRVAMDRQTLAGVLKRLDDFNSSAAELLSTPAGLVSNLTDILGLVDVLAPILAVYGFSPGDAPRPRPRTERTSGRTSTPRTRSCSGSPLCAPPSSCRNRRSTATRQRSPRVSR
jgi:prophage DNA circulation protein